MARMHNRLGFSSTAVAGVLASILVVVAIVYLVLGAGAGPGLQVGSQEETRSPSAEGKQASTITPPPIPPAQQAQQVPDEDKPVADVQIRPATIQLGYVEPGAVKQATVEVVNNSAFPVNMIGAKKGCSCTEVELQPGIIPPGESREVTAIFTAGLTPTTKNSKVGVLFEKYRSVDVPLNAIVSRKVQATPKDFRMHRDGSYNGPVVRTKGRILVNSIDGRPIRILSAGGKPPIPWPGSGNDPMIPSIQHEVAVDLGDHDKDTLLDPDGNLLPQFWIFETDHPEAPVVEVRLIHDAHRPYQREKERQWVFLEKCVVVDAVEPGGSTTFELPIAWNRREGRTQQIHEVVSTSPDLEVELVGIRADGPKTKATVRVTPSPGTRGPFQHIIEFVSREHRAPLVVVGYVNPDPPGPGGDS